MLYNSYITVTYNCISQLYDWYITIIWLSYNCHITVIYDSYITVINDSYITVIQQLYDCCITVI